MWINPFCIKAFEAWNTIIHELYHVVAFGHEQDRAEMSDYFHPISSE